MKKLLILLLLIPPLLSPGQGNRIDAVCLVYQPVDNGLGIRIDYQIMNLRLYNSLSYGNQGLYRANNLKQHTKLTAGILIPLQDYRGHKYNIMAGINYHHLRSDGYFEACLDPRIFDPWSFELGVSIYIGRIAIGTRTDILRWEPCVDIGYRFLLWEQKYKQPCMR